MNKINLIAFRTLNTLVVVISLIALPKGLREQNKNSISFGLRNNETNINTYLNRIMIYSTNLNSSMIDGHFQLHNNIGTEISYTRFTKLAKNYYMNVGASYLQERSDVVTTYTINGPVYLRNVGVNFSFEKRISLNNEVSLGFNAGLLIIKSIKFPVGISDGGSYNLTIGGNATDTIESMETKESLYFKSDDFKITPRFEINAYFKSGKHLIKFSAFYQFEAKKYNYLEYNWSYKDYYHRDYYKSEPCNSDNFRMKIFGLSTGYCF